MNCCENWVKARENETEPDGGCLIEEHLHHGYSINNQVVYGYICDPAGVGFPPIRFCPWCGAEKPTEQTEG